MPGLEFGSGLGRAWPSWKTEEVAEEPIELRPKLEPSSPSWARSWLALIFFLFVTKLKTFFILFSSNLCFCFLVTFYFCWPGISRVTDVSLPKEMHHHLPIKVTRLERSMNRHSNQFRQKTKQLTLFYRVRKYTCFCFLWHACVIVG